LFRLPPAYRLPAACLPAGQAGQAGQVGRIEQVNFT